MTRCRSKPPKQFLKSGFITVDLFAASSGGSDAKGQVEMRRRAADAPALASTFAVGEEAEQSGPVMLREVGKIAAPIDAPGVAFAAGQHGAHRRRRAHPQNRPLLPGRHRGWLRCLARILRARRQRPCSRLERHRRRRRPRSGRQGRALLSLVPARWRRQPDQQAQRLADPQRPLRPPDSARRGRHGSFPGAASRAMPSGPSRSKPSSTTASSPTVYTASLSAVRKPGLAGVSFDSREYAGRSRASCPMLPIVTLAYRRRHSRSWASRTGSPSSASRIASAGTIGASACSCRAT